MQESPTRSGSVSAISRRSAAAALALAPLLVRARNRSGNRSWRIAQSTALSGPLRDLGTAIHTGARVAFDEINAQGGVHGLPIELVTRDDGYEAKRAVANVEGFLQDPDLFALFNCMGTPAIAAMLPKVIESGVPFFAPFTGAGFARPKGARNILPVRASYAEEAQKATQHLVTIGIRRIAIAFQDNAFGREVIEGTQAAVQQYKLSAPPTVSVNLDGSNLAAAVAAIADTKSDALIVGLAGRPAIDFIKAVRATQPGLSLYAVSVLGAAGTIDALGEDGVGIVISQVVPPPLSPIPIARDFRAAWKASSSSLELSHLALEGYINARAFAAVLRRAGPAATPQSFIDSAWTTKRHDLGGFEITFSEPGKGASTYVNLTMVSRNGRLIH